jgi:hypothetical protein
MRGITLVCRCPAGRQVGAGGRRECKSESGPDAWHRARLVPNQFGGQQASIELQTAGFGCCGRGTTSGYVLAVLLLLSVPAQGPGVSLGPTRM